MAGRRARAYEDLRSDSGRRESGIKPGLMQSLFGGGVSKGSASADLREGRAPARPSSKQSLFAGGRARSLASEDLIMGAPGEGSDRPANLQPLADGGEVGDEDSFKIAAEDVIDAFKVGKPEKLARALQAFVRLCQSEPHDEG